ncbi:MAG: hypothetical protein PVS3B3_35560 [Ktedonobacteraceae bacterium]
MCNRIQKTLLLSVASEKATARRTEVQSPNWLWHKWAPIAGSPDPVSTCLLPFARVPGILLGIWGVMVILGIIVALTLQSLVIAPDPFFFHLRMA